MDLRRFLKPVLGGVIVLLVGALGLELTNTDFDLGKLLSTGSLQESKVQRGADGTILIGECSPEKYNCSNFATQAQAQAVFADCGGKGQDVHELDRDADGVACEDLPKTTSR